MRSLEHNEQVALIGWARCQRFNGTPIADDLHAIPNGGQRHPAVAAKLKAEGVTPGIPDLMLTIPVAPYHGMFIEMKSRGGIARGWKRGRRRERVDQMQRADA